LNPVRGLLFRLGTTQYGKAPRLAPEPDAREGNAASPAKVPRMQNVTLQINLAPGDYYHAVHMLDHHIEVFESQTDENLLTFDFNPASHASTRMLDRDR